MELCRGTPQGTSCVAADGGRTRAVEQIESLLSEDYRVLAIDPFYLGESKLEERGYLFALLRIIRRRAADWECRPINFRRSRAGPRHNSANRSIEHVAIGPRISLAALIAAATGDATSGRSNSMLHGSLGSLREIIENNWSVDEYPEMFCFGLLQHCDIDDLIELAKPCEVVRK